MRRAFRKDAGEPPELMVKLAQNVVMKAAAKAEKACRAAEKSTPKPRYVEAVGPVKATAEAHG